MGGDHTIAVQSMCDTKTDDIDKTVAQIHALEEADCDIVRVAAPDREGALAIKEIKNQINIPLVADIHFDYKLALLAIESGADKDPYQSRQHWFPRPAGNGGEGV